ncbi:28S ribosomal protein S16, mitochondrial-like [Gigantopelta aegis]|uniref:28S ribosomal protein S16, mitochondrial-like n=1 Tax=Gigantopelta aegis TaxID=1735272 RepID=UPI001B88C6DE|nr:28S ribosomal protein S16, mitochondrial-like [Gigantopelta aegis]
MPRLPQRPSYLIIRFSMYGCTNRPYFRIVVMPNRKPRQGRVLEQIGSYDPLPNMHNEKLVAVNFERMKYWIANGAKLSLPVEKLLGLGGFFPIHPMTYIEAERNRKEILAEVEKLKAAESESSAPS